LTGPSLYTVGHGTLPSDDLVTLLREAGIAAIVDVRRVPRSAHNPQFDKAALSESLLEANLDYRWEAALGGWRSAQGWSRDGALRNRSFRNFAGYMRSREFRDAVRTLVCGSAQRPTTVLCSESVWWKCHRRLIADHAALVEGVSVVHLMHDGRLEAHRITEGARVDAAELFYDAGQMSLDAEHR
jgi:uncharacterized protein (DUF488 family)